MKQPEHFDIIEICEQIVNDAVGSLTQGDVVHHVMAAHPALNRAQVKRAAKKQLGRRKRIQFSRPIISALEALASIKVTPEELFTSFPKPKFDTPFEISREAPQRAFRIPAQKAYRGDSPSRTNGAE